MSGPGQRGRGRGRQGIRGGRGPPGWLSSSASTSTSRSCSRSPRRGTSMPSPPSTSETALAVWKPSNVEEDSVSNVGDHQDQLPSEAALQTELLLAAASSSLDRLMNCVETYIDNFTELNVTTALVWIARISTKKNLHQNDDCASRRDPRFASLLEAASAKVSLMSGAMMSRIVWAVAKLGLEHQILLNRVAERAAIAASLVRPQHYVKLCWGFAKLDYKHDAFLAAVIGSIEEMWDRLSAVHLCHALWAICHFQFLNKLGATVNHCLERLLILLAQHDVVCEADLRSGKPLPKAIVLPSDFVALLVEVTSFREGIRSVLVERLQAAGALFWARHRSIASAGDLFSLLWVLAKACMWDEASSVLESSVDLLENGVVNLAAERLVSGIWALGALVVRGHMAFSPRLQKLLPLVSNQAIHACLVIPSIVHLTNLLWGFVSAGLPQAHTLLDAAVEPGLRLAGQIGHESGPELGSHLCCLLWCYAAQGCRHKRLFLVIVDRLVPYTEDLRWPDLADAIWSCATLDIAHPEFLSAAAKRVVDQACNVGDVAFSDALRLAWSFTCTLADLSLQHRAVHVLLPQQALENALKPLAVQAQPSFIWPLLHQVLSLQKGLIEGMRDDLLFIVENQLAQHVHDTLATTVLRAEIRTVLAEIGAEHEKVGRVAGTSRVPVDVALPARRAAFDAQQQNFVMRDLESGQDMPNAFAQMRRQCLQQEGWTLRLIRIPSLALPAETFRTDLRELIQTYFIVVNL